MENTIKMKIKNEDGVEIVKDVPANLYSNYLNIGWEVVKQEKKFSIPKDKKEEE